MYSNEAYLLEQLQESGLLEDREIQQAKSGLKPGESTVDVLIKTGVLSDEQVARTVAVNAGMEYLDLDGFEAHPSLKDLMNVDLAKKYKIAPIGMNHSALQVVVSDPFDFETLDALPHVLQPELEFYCSTPALIKTLQSNIYGSQVDVIKDKTGTDGDDAPVIRLVQNMLMEAFKNKASDIHVEPLEKDIRVRYRMDGVMVDVEHHPKRLHSAIIGRLKIMTGSMQLDENASRRTAASR